MILLYFSQNRRYNRADLPAHVGGCQNPIERSKELWSELTIGILFVKILKKRKTMRRKVQEHLTQAVALFISVDSFDEARRYQRR